MPFWIEIALQSLTPGVPHKSSHKPSQTKLIDLPSITSNCTASPVPAYVLWSGTFLDRPEISHHAQRSSHPDEVSGIDDSLPGSRILPGRTPQE